MSDDEVYQVLGPEQIRLSPETREYMARVYGWTDKQMARYFLNEHRKREAGLIQRDREE